MKLKRVIRFEDSTGKGMYFATDYAHEVLTEHVKHPSPDNDDLLWEGLEVHRYANDERCSTEGYMTNFYFGFEDKKQCRRWVFRDEWLIGLHERDILISEYFCNPDDVVVGHTQAVFCSHDYKKTHSILDFFKIKA